MKARVGLPRAMYHHYFYPYIKTFFQEIGMETVVSPPTNRTILENGVRRAVDEACLPIKVYYGHVEELDRQGLDYIFVPRLISVEHRTYLCPKLMGLPDMIRAELRPKTALIDPVIDLSRNEAGFYEEMHALARRFKVGRCMLVRALKRAREAQEEVTKITVDQRLTWPEAISVWEGGKQKEFGEGRITVGLLGHGYVIYDPQVSMELITTLRRMSVRVVTPEMLDKGAVERGEKTLPKRIFWSLGHLTVGAAFALREAGVDGIIHTACFGCGPDSLIGEMIQKKISDIPLLLLTLDEHTGTAGLRTRLEAFIDMLERKKRHAGNVSSHGEYPYSSAQSF